MLSARWFRVSMLACLALASPLVSPSRADDEAGVGPNLRFLLTLTHEPADGPRSVRAYGVVVPAGNIGARIDSGFRMPIPSTSFNTSETAGGKVVPVTSFTYQNIGFDARLEAVPAGRGRILTDLELSFSLITGRVGSDESVSQPIIGSLSQRLEDLVLRDGETLRVASLDDLEEGSVHIDIRAEVLR